METFTIRKTFFLEVPAKYWVEDQAKAGALSVEVEEFEDNGVVKWRCKAVFEYE